MRGQKSDVKIKNAALKLRRKGKTYNQIISMLGVPKSTLNYWFIGIDLTPAQKAAIRKNWIRSIVESRANAIKWHNEQKSKRLEVAKSEAEKLLDSIDLTNDLFLELALSFLYLGEGTKKSITTSLGNSDPQILGFYLYCLQRLYGVDHTKLRVVLHLRADQNVEEMKQYWSKQLNIPIAAIKGAYIDKRTIGRPTYETYKGVCVIEGGSVAIQRRLVWISRLFCEKIALLRG